jgi:hypothetical protein
MISMLGEGAGRHSLLFPSNPRNGMRLGAAVTTFRGRGRDEIVAGAPLVREVHFFFCSMLAGDRPEEIQGDRGCIPVD